MSSQWVDACGWLSDLAAEHTQVGQGDNVVGAVAVLGDAHGVENSAVAAGFLVDGLAMCAFALSVPASCLNNLLLRNTGCQSSPFWCVTLEDGGKCIIIFGAFRYEGLIHPPFANDHMHHRQENVDIGAGVRLEEEGGVIDEGDASGVDDDKVSAFLHCTHDLIADNRMRFRRIGSGDEDAICVADLADGIGHCAPTEGLHEACNGAAVSKPGTVIDVIGADHCSHEFLEEVIILVGAAGGS